MACLACSSLVQQALAADYPERYRCTLKASAPFGALIYLPPNQLILPVLGVFYGSDWHAMTAIVVAAVDVGAAVGAGIALDRIRRHRPVMSVAAFTVMTALADAAVYYVDRT